MCMKESTLKRQGTTGGEEGDFKRPRPVPLVRKKQYSNRLADCVKIFCCECDQVVTLSGVRKHLAGVHKMVMTEYRQLYGNPEKQIIRMVYHSCKVCRKDVVLDYLQLGKHLKKAHKIKGAAVTEYNNKYLEMLRVKNPSKKSTSPPSKKASKNPVEPMTPSPTPQITPTTVSKEETSPPTPTSTSPRLAPLPTCTRCSKVFKSNMQLKMHTRREHGGA